MKNLSKVILSALMFLVSSLAAGMEVNILSERQEFLLKPSGTLIIWGRCSTILNKEDGPIRLEYFSQTKMIVAPI